jgi:LL-diaminopimelate aminotransferase
MMKTIGQAAERLSTIPPYLFAEIDRKKALVAARGVDIISLAIGDPDRPTPASIVSAMQQAVADPATHNYPPYQGTQAFRQAALDWLERRFQLGAARGGFDVELDIVSSIGSKEAIHNAFLAFVNPGDVTLIPDPAYPVYRSSTLLAGGEPYLMPLTPANHFLPDLDAIPADVLRRAKLLWLNYPNNPTGAVAPLEYLAKAVAFAKQHNLLLCHDNAYSEMAYDGYRPPSIFEVEGAKDCAIEFFSCSKAYNMTGWRVGFVVGNRQAISVLGRLKTNIDSGIFKAVQQAAIAAYQLPDQELAALMAVYQRRRDLLVQGFRKLGWPVTSPSATLYLWLPIPAAYPSSAAFAEAVLERCGVVITPGIGYGAAGEGFVRLSLTLDDDRIAEALERLQQAGICFEMS